MKEIAYKALCDFAFGSLDDDGSAWTVQKGELFKVRGREKQVEAMLREGLATELHD
jgi:hypothetical protein